MAELARSTDTTDISDPSVNLPFLCAHNSTASSYPPFPLLAMSASSSQSLSDVVASIIRPMLDAPSFSSQLQTYVQALSVSGSFSECHPGSTDLMRAFIRAHSSEFDDYLMAHNSVPDPASLTETDDLSLEREVSTFREFLIQHQYSSVEELMAAVEFEECDAKAFVEGSFHTTSGFIKARVRTGFRIWRAWRVYARGRPPVSLYAWMQMSRIATSMTDHCIRSRVQCLTARERREALAEPLATKRERREALTEALATKRKRKAAEL